MKFVESVRNRPTVSFEEHWTRFETIFSDRGDETGPPLVWRPDESQVSRSNLGTLMAELGIHEYSELHRWSVRQRERFWERVVDRLRIVFEKRPETVLDLASGAANPRWLPGAVFNCVDSCFAEAPGRPAIISGSEGSSELQTISYGDLEREVNRFANGLREQGFEPGDAIALYMPMNVPCVIAYLGTVRAGCRVVSIADSFPSAEIRKRIEIGDAGAVVTVENFTRGGRIIDLYQKIKDADAPRAVVIPSSSVEGITLREGDLCWDDFLSSRDRFESTAGDPYGVINLLFSSGTTGTPKAIPWTHLTPIKCAMDGHFHQDIHKEDVVSWPTNIGWMMGPWLVFASLINRATMALYDGIPTGEGFIRFVRDAGVTVLGVVPSFVRTWRSSGNVSGWDRIRLFSSTGEPSNRKDYLWLMSCTGYRAPVIEYCGGTEIGGGYVTGTVAQPCSPATFTTPALGVDLIVLREDGTPASVGEAGEVYLVPPSIGFSQTLLNGNHDKVYFDGCPTGPQGELLRRHGDRLVRLHQGFYRAQGRSDDTMNLGGIKVSSLELEGVFNTHESVYESAAVSVQPEGEGAEQLIAYVVAKESAKEKESLDANRLRRELGSMVAKSLNPLFKIEDVRVVDALPRTASNKIMRRKLRSQYTSGD